MHYWLVEAVWLLQQSPTSMLLAGIGAFLSIQHFFTTCGSAHAVGNRIQTSKSPLLHHIETAAERERGGELVRWCGAG
ncbi:hypothetical protein XELAEV_18011328mg [Xenopus laevis]|uniref:Uncharacterized protein n=1 Tax=Xenopus laevis TaxID=8355 RepID=A0A974DKI0_XENLA|nr:hypothetical protein XELAEV_18011328mg [Xenopus laevis]